MRTTIKSNNSGGSSTSWTNAMGESQQPQNGSDRMKTSGGRGSREREQKRVLHAAAGRKKRINAN